MDMPFQTESVESPLFTRELYLVPSWVQQIELLGHLCQYSHNLLALLGGPSSGKTSFSHLLADYRLPGLRKIVLEGQHIQDTDQLMQAISTGFNLPWPVDNSNHAFEGLNFQHDKSLTWTVIVDDAHKLSPDVLKTLVKLVDFEQPPKQQLRLVLIGDQSLEAQLQSTEYEPLIGDRLHALELSGWGIEDIDFVLNEKGKDTSANFSQAILEQTGGQPKLVMDRLNLVMQDKEALPPKQNKMHWVQTLDKPVVYGVSVGVALGLGFLVLNFGDDELPVSPPMNIAQTEHDSGFATEGHLKPNRPTTNIALNDTNRNDIKATTEPLETVDDVLAEYDATDIVVKPAEPKIASNKTKVKPVEPKQVSAPTYTQARAEKAVKRYMEDNVINQAALKAKEKAEPIIAKVAATPKKSTMPVKQVEKAPTVAAKTTPPELKAQSLALTTDEQTVLSEDGGQYTLQLAGSSKAPDMQKFLREQGLRASGQVIRSTRSGKEWYVIIYGRYPNYAAAKKAANDISKQGKVTPWVRTYKSIQTDIRKFAKLKGFNSVVILPKPEEQPRDIG